jgi:hypothetical protein
MSIPRVYAAINAVSAELARAGIPKAHTNFNEQYQYRGIDDVYNRLAPLLAAHKLCILPRVLERVCTDRTGVTGDLLVNVTLKIAFDLVSVEDGSSHSIEAYGEALDAGDKATSKAMTAAYKYAILQTFCIPVSGSEDADADTHKLRRSSHVPEPVQGWEQWVKDITEMIRICETIEALDRVQNSNRQLLKALSRERPELYTALGEAISGRRRRMSPGNAPPTVPKQARRRRAATAAPAELEVVDA